MRSRASLRSSTSCRRRSAQCWCATRNATDGMQRTKGNTQRMKCNSRSAACNGRDEMQQTTWNMQRTWYDRADTSVDQLPTTLRSVPPLRTSALARADCTLSTHSGVLVVLTRGSKARLRGLADGCKPARRGVPSRSPSATTSSRCARSRRLQPMLSAAGPRPRVQAWPSGGCPPVRPAQFAHRWNARYRSAMGAFWI